jgi:hypothetical protein
MPLQLPQAFPMAMAHSSHSAVRDLIANKDGITEKDYDGITVVFFQCAAIVFGQCADLFSRRN